MIPLEATPARQGRTGPQLSAAAAAGDTPIGKLAITGEGRYSKFVPQMSHLCLSADRAFQRGRRVPYVTERAVFRPEPVGLKPRPRRETKTERPQSA